MVASARDARCAMRDTGCPDESGLVPGMAGRAVPHAALCVNHSFAKRRVIVRVCRVIGASRFGFHAGGCVSHDGRARR